MGYHVMGVRQHGFPRGFFLIDEIPLSLPAGSVVAPIVGANPASKVHNRNHLNGSGVTQQEFNKKDVFVLTPRDGKG
jgi:hypothetical protein